MLFFLLLYDIAFANVTGYIKRPWTSEEPPLLSGERNVSFSNTQFYLEGME